MSREQQKDVLGYIEKARQEGAEKICGGAAPVDADLAHGCFVEPTILGAGCRTSIWRDKAFGPVLAVHEVDSFDEAVSAVNDSRFRLSAAIFTRDLEAAHLFAARAKRGQVAVNLPTSGWDLHMPLGGFRASGSAFKGQGGLDALRFYTRTKTVAIPY